MNVPVDEAREMMGESGGRGIDVYKRQVVSRSALLRDVIKK